MLTVTLCPIKELSNSVKVVEKADIEEPVMPSRPHKPNPCHIDGAGIDSCHWYNKLIGYLKPSRSLNHVDTLKVKVNFNSSAQYTPATQK